MVVPDEIFPLEAKPMTAPGPQIPQHIPIAAARHGALQIASYQLGGHLVWAATDGRGVVALAGTREELQRALDEFEE
ncbi:hypothetical protein [Candidatus Frankia alpina]|uniref:hypothetical protein n=1 Tax=Candidatus Frankia alpina TaxID=2699483 RepID=UPI0013D8D81A|nr:hypothetical protein [Candidatus Frankia alpina]